MVHRSGPALRIGSECAPGPQVGNKGGAAKDIRLPEVEPCLSPDLNKHEVRCAPQPGSAALAP